MNIHMYMYICMYVCLYVCAVSWGWSRCDHQLCRGGFQRRKVRERQNTVLRGHQHHGYVCMYIFMFWLSLYALFLFLFVVYILSYNHTFTCIHTYIHFLCSSGYQADLAYNVALCYYREKQYGKAVNLYAYIHTCMHTVINMKYMHTYISLMYIDWLSCMYVCM